MTPVLGNDRVGTASHAHWLDPIGGFGLMIIMLGATVLTPTLLGMDVIMALPNVILGALAAGIAYGRWQLAPLKRR